MNIYLLWLDFFICKRIVVAKEPLIPIVDKVGNIHPCIVYDMWHGNIKI